MKLFVEYILEKEIKARDFIKKVERLESLHQISWFRGILKIKKIGIETYEIIFIGMYSLVSKGNNSVNQ
ncbi:hypothetical protein J7J69_03940 [candidate division WOR-3 bacterium]|nr:hypothetical protein [candidate division WOR-3 bacterium]